MKQNINIFSDFNTEILYNFLSQKLDKSLFKINKPIFGFFYENSFKFIKNKKKSHLNIVWTKVDSVINSFNKILDYEKVNHKALIKETDIYINLIKQLSLNSDHVLVFSWSLPQLSKGKFLNDFTNDAGITKNLNILNKRVADSLKKYKNISFLNTNYITDKNDADYNPKLWFLAKIPFTQKIFELASNEIFRTLQAIKGQFIKLIVVDLDNTLWGGNVGDLGWQKINLGGHNALGEAFVEFQKKLRALNNLGVQLAISSKNEESKALAAITKNKNMILKQKNFISWKINWEDKAKNIKEILKELNLSAENVLFLDDNLRERMRVKKGIKGINVLDLSDGPFFYASILMNSGNFDFSRNTTIEDSKRSKYYKDNSKRIKLKEKFISEENWLRSLNTKVSFKKLDSSNQDRILQLILRVNQMNLTTRRLSLKNLLDLQKKPNNYLMCCDLKDRFGEMGIIGFFNLEIRNNIAVVKDFLLSCRAFGRDIEKSMCIKMIQLVKSKKVRIIELNYIKTEKNLPCLNFLKKNFKSFKKNKFILSDFNNFKLPRHLTILKS
jgi:FkbH-like protein